MYINHKFAYVTGDFTSQMSWVLDTLSSHPQNRWPCLRCRSRKTSPCLSQPVISALYPMGPSVATASWLSFSCELTELHCPFSKSQPEIHLLSKYSWRFSKGKNITWFCHCHYFASLCRFSFCDWSHFLLLPGSPMAFLLTKSSQPPITFLC